MGPLPLVAGRKSPLQLAIDIEVPLATLDRAPAAAARDEAIEVID